MRSAIGYLIVAVVLVAAGAVLWRGSDLEMRVAAAERDLVTLRYQEAGARAVEPPPAWSAYLPGAAKTVEDATETERHVQVLGRRVHGSRRRSERQAAGRQRRLSGAAA